MSTQTSDRGMAVNAVIGAVATVVLSFVLVSPVVGGALAGFLQDGTRRDGTVVGALSGVVVAVPAALLLAGLSLAVPVRSDVAALGVAIAPALVLVVAFLLAAAYLIGLGAVGGYLGVLVHEWRDG